MLFELTEIPDEATAEEVFEAIAAAPPDWDVTITRRAESDPQYRYIVTVSTGRGDDFLCQHEFGTCPAMALRKTAREFIANPLSVHSEESAPESTAAAE